MDHWKTLADQVDMGLTWIDHEYIDKPVERNNREGEEKEEEVVVVVVC